MLSNRGWLGLLCRGPFGGEGVGFSRGWHRGTAQGFRLQHEARFLCIQLAAVLNHDVMPSASTQPVELRHLCSCLAAGTLVGSMGLKASKHSPL